MGFLDLLPLSFRKIYTVCPQIWGIFRPPFPFCADVIYGRRRKSVGILRLRTHVTDDLPVFRAEGVASRVLPLWVLSEMKKETKGVRVGVEGGKVRRVWKK